MRVITGTARGSKLKTLEGFDIRPTTDVVKEAMFSIIQFDIEGRIVLDLYAGSGQLGIEALSRGAEKAFFVDSSVNSIRVVKDNLEHTHLADKAEVINMPDTAFLRCTREKFDVALIDPPYERKHIQKVLPRLTEVMNADGIIVCEHESTCTLPESVGEFSVVKVYKYGKTHITVYKQKTEEADS